MDSSGALCEHSETERAHRGCNSYQAFFGINHTPIDLKPPSSIPTLLHAPIPSTPSYDSGNLRRISIPHTPLCCWRLGVCIQIMVSLGNSQLALGGSKAVLGHTSTGPMATLKRVLKGSVEGHVKWTPRSGETGLEQSEVLVQDLWRYPSGRVMGCLF